MSGLHVHLVVALVWFAVARVHAVLSPAGKCDDCQYNTTDLTIQKLVSQKLWNFAWITDCPELANIDQGFMQLSTDPQTHNYIAYNEVVLANGFRAACSCVFKDIGKPYFIEECVNDDGSTVIFRDYALSFVPAKGGLYLRCVEGDGVTIPSQTVIIGVSGYPPLTNTQVQEMLQLNLQIFGVPLRPLAWSIS